VQRHCLSLIGVHDTNRSGLMPGTVVSSMNVSQTCARLNLEPCFLPSSQQSRFEPAVTMSSRKEAIEFCRYMPDCSCQPVRTILDPRGGNAISIKDIRARYATSAYVQHQRPQYSLPPRCLSPYSSYFPNEMFEGAIRRYLFNVYCRNLSPLFTASITTPIACASSSSAVAAPSSAVAVQTPWHLLDPNSDTGGSDIGSVNGDSLYAGSETDPEEATETKNARREILADTNRSGLHPDSDLVKQMLASIMAQGFPTSSQRNMEGEVGNFGLSIGNWGVRRTVTKGDNLSAVDTVGDSTAVAAVAAAGACTPWTKIKILAANAKPVPKPPPPPSRILGQWQGGPPPGRPGMPPPHLVPWTRLEAVLNLHLMD